jgi:hypothetical protein
MPLAVIGVVTVSYFRILVRGLDLQKERDPVQLYGRQPPTTKGSLMAERSVKVSIVVEVAGSKRVKRQLIVSGELVDEAVQSELRELGRDMLSAVYEELDVQLGQEVPESWQNVGKEEREVLTVLGPVRMRRRVYRDDEGKRHKPLDDGLGLVKYERMTESVKAKGAYLASEVSYRDAAAMLSWMLDEKVNHSRIQRMVWDVGTALDEAEKQEREAVFTYGKDMQAGAIPARTLYGETDGVHISLQREKKRSTEVRVGVVYSGKRLIAQGRRATENKICVTAIAEGSQEWQEMLVKEMYATYDLESVEQLITGGDSNTWVRHSFDRLGIPQIFQLDRFHLYRAARRALGRSKETNDLVRRCCTFGLEAVADELDARIAQTSGLQRHKIIKFANYLYQNADALVDYHRRIDLPFVTPGGLGAIEGNVDKLVVHRMKGRGRSWRLVGAKAMLALCRHKTELRQKAFRLPKAHADRVSIGQPKRSRTKDADWLQRNVPVLHSSAEGRPWVQTLKKRINGSSDLSFI